MRHRFCLLLGCCLIPLGQALAEPPPAPGADTQDIADISEKLDMFVSEAIAEGLLTPVRAKVAPADSETMAVIPSPSRPANQPSLDCTQPYFLDFKELAQLTQYREIYALREQLNLSPAVVDTRANLNLAKAYIALGLNSEALLALRDATDPEMISYQNLAVLMDNNQQPDIAYFRQLTSCHQQAGIWLSLALLVDGQNGGARLLEQHMTEFRQLPLHLRINIAALTAPALEDQKERILGQKILADFSDDELRDSSQLQFSAAFLDLGNGNLEAEQDVQSFLNQPQYQEAALSLMLRNHRSIDIAYKDVLVGDLVRKIERAESEREIAASLSYALRELSTDSRYIPIMQLADLPILQTQSAQDEIRHYLIAGLRRDLGGEDPLHSLVAINALINESGILDGHSYRNTLYAQATTLAFGFGLISLGEELAQKADIGEASLLQRGRLAYRRGDHSSVYRLALSHPDNQPMNLLAALSAIEQYAPQQLAVFEARLDLEPETILSLIEQDAVIGQWMVSKQVYEAAEILTDDAHRMRVQRVINLKHIGRDVALPARAFTMADLPATLHRTGASLATPTMETR